MIALLIIFGLMTLISVATMVFGDHYATAIIGIIFLMPCGAAFLITLVVYLVEQFMPSIHVSFGG